MKQPKFKIGDTVKITEFPEYWYGLGKKSSLYNSIKDVIGKTFTINGLKWDGNYFLYRGFYDDIDFNEKCLELVLESKNDTLPSESKNELEPKAKAYLEALLDTKKRFLHTMLECENKAKQGTLTELTYVINLRVD